MQGNVHACNDLIVDFPTTSRRKNSAPPLSVRIAEYSQMAFIENPPKSILRKRWNSKQDGARFKEARNAEVFAMRQVLYTKQTQPLDNEELVRCVGIEVLLSTKVLKRSARQAQRVRCAVLSEQLRQNELGIVDDEAIRRASEEISQWSREWAHEIAMHRRNIQHD